MCTRDNGYHRIVRRIVVTEGTVAELCSNLFTADPGMVVAHIV